MNIFKYSQKLLSSPFLKKPALWISLLCAIIIIILSMRACGRHHVGSNHTYIIGRDNSWNAMQLIGRERNLLAFTNDLLETIAHQAEFRFAWHDTTHDTLFEGLDDGSYDAILSSERPDIYNQQKYAFSELIIKFGPVLIVRQDAAISSLKQMQGLTIGVGYGLPLTFNAIRQSGANVYNLIFVTYPTINKALEALSKDRIDGVIMDALPAYTMLNKFYTGQLKIATPPLTDQGLRLISLKDEASETLINNFSEALRTLKKNGTYDSLIDKWDMVDPDRKFRSPFNAPA